MSLLAFVWVMAPRLPTAIVSAAIAETAKAAREAADGTAEKSTARHICARNTIPAALEPTAKNAETGVGEPW